MKHKALGLDMLLKDLEIHAKKTEYLKSKIKEETYTKISHLRECEILRRQIVDASKE